MEFFDVIKNRHSIRKFEKMEIEETKIKKILDAANKAPSAGNLQSYEIFLIKNPEKKKQLTGTSLLGQDFIAEASIILIFCSSPSRSSVRYSKRGEQLYSIQDATIAATFAMLAATDLDLASCWIGAFDDRKVLKVIGNPKDLTPVVILPIGYPAEKPDSRSRRKLEDLVHEI